MARKGNVNVNVNVNVKKIQMKNALKDKTILLKYTILMTQGAFKIVARVANILQAYPYPASVLLRLATLKSSTILNARMTHMPYMQ